MPCSSPVRPTSAGPMRWSRWPSVPSTRRRCARRERFRANWFIDPSDPIPARWTDGLAVPDWLRDMLLCDGTVAPVFTDGAPRCRSDAPSTPCPTAPVASCCRDRSVGCRGATRRDGCRCTTSSTTSITARPTRGTWPGCARPVTGCIIEANSGSAATPTSPTGSPSPTPTAGSSTPPPDPANPPGHPPARPTLPTSPRGTALPKMADVPRPPRAHHQKRPTDATHRDAGTLLYNEQHADFLLVKDAESTLLDYLATLVAKEYLVYNNARAASDELAEELVRILVPRAPPPCHPPRHPTAVTIALAASSWASSAASMAPTMVKKPWIIPSKRRCWVGTPAASSAAA